MGKRETAKRDQVVAKIAEERLGFETLEMRKSDSLDFREVAVWSVKDALEAAYLAGRAAGKVSP